MKKNANKAPGQRQLKVSEAIRSALAKIFLEEDFYGSCLQGISITISEVRIGSDLKHAIVFVLPLGGKVPEGFLEALRDLVPQLRHKIGPFLKLRYTPNLSFRIDDSFEYANKINTILSKIQ